MMNMLKADLRATLRNPKWIGISLLLTIVLSFGSVMDFEERYLQLAYFYLPIFLTIFVSTFIAGERKSGFISNVFTSPITRKEYFLEKFLLGLSLGFIYLLTTLPFSLLHLFYSGSGFLFLFLKYLISAIILVTFSSALGIFISVLSNKDENVAIALSFVFCVVSLWLFSIFTGQVEEFLKKGLSPQWQLIYISHFSPHVCILDFLNTYYAFQAVNSVISLLVPALFILIFLGFSYIFFKKLQNVEGNDFKLVGAVPIAILLILALLAPPMLGNNSYSARGMSFMNNPWSIYTSVANGGAYLESFGNLETVSWGRAIDVYLSAKGENLHNVTITFPSPESLDLERLGGWCFIRSEPLYFEELEVKRVKTILMSLSL